MTIDRSKALMLTLACVALWALIPVLAALLLVLFFHEPLLPVYLLGLVAVIAAGLLSQ